MACYRDSFFSLPVTMNRLQDIFSVERAEEIVTDDLVMNCRDVIFKCLNVKSRFEFGVA
jgi:hypothetical protein